MDPVGRYFQASERSLNHVRVFRNIGLLTVFTHVHYITLAARYQSDRSFPHIVMGRNMWPEFQQNTRRNILQEHHVEGLTDLVARR